jgi:LmbE family N-acetylglucosaminyl deacetylase
MDALTDRTIRGAGTPESVWAEWLRGHPLPRVSVRELVNPRGTVHVVAPHPDDEMLPCGGMIRQLFLAGIAVQIWAVSDGEGSHPDSPRWPREALATARTHESEQALALLAPGTPRHRLEIPDGSIDGNEGRIAVALSDALRPGDTVVAPWQWDGHPDHEAASRASRSAAAACRCEFLEVPIWAWHWVEPSSGVFPLDRAVAIDLDAATLLMKRRAIEGFRTQLEPDPSNGRPPILARTALDRLLRPFEVVFA